MNMLGDFIPFLKDTMNYSAANQKVIANNIANYNTPGYKDKELQFDQVVKDNSVLPLETTESNQISNNPSTLSFPSYQEIEPSTGSSRVDGNNVDQTNEMVKMLQNNYIFTTSINAVNQEFALDKTAIGN